MRYTRNLALLFHLGCGTFAAAQAGFIYRLDTAQELYSGTGRSIYEVDSGYLILGHQVSHTLGLTHPVIFKIDQQGHFLWRREYFEQDTFHYNWGPVDSFLSAPDTITAPLVRFGANSNNYRLDVFRLDLDGDTLWSQTVQDITPMDSFMAGFDCARPAWDGGLLLAGFTDSLFDQEFSRAYLVKTDHGGNPIWNWSYVQDHFYRITQPAAYPDNGAVVTGYRSGSELDRNFLFRISPSGQERWHRYFGNNATYSDQAVGITPDSGIVVWGGYSEVPWDYWEEEMMLTKWDSLGTQLWNTRCCRGYYTASGDIEVQPDGTFVTVGSHPNQSLIVKFSASGDSLWGRVYATFYLEQYVYDVRRTSDGGFITTGTSRQSTGDPFPGMQTIWGFKTDSLGCVVPGCQNVGVGEYLLDLNDKLLVSPNPATDRVHVEMRLPEGFSANGDVRVILMDAQGRQVLQKNAAQNFNLITCDLDLNALPNGTYFVHMADRTRWLAGAKVVKQ